MIKPITTSPFVKRAVLGTLMAGIAATGSFAATNRSSSESARPQYSEVSSTASSAAKAMSMPISTSSTGKNQQLVNNLRSLAQDSEETAAYNRLIDREYEDLGLYGGTASLQLRFAELGINQTIVDFYRDKKALLTNAAEAVGKNQAPDAKFLPLYTSLGGDIGTMSKGSIEAAITHFEDDILSPLQKHIISGPYSNLRRQNYSFMTEEAYAAKRKPGAETVNNDIDKCANFFFQEDKTKLAMYNKKTKEFDAAQNGSKTPEQKANLIAYKIFLIDSTVAKEIFARNKFISKNKDFGTYFEKNYLSKEPKPIR